MTDHDAGPIGGLPSEEDAGCDADNEVDKGPQTRRIEIRKRLPGRRLDKYLRSKYPRISRTALQLYIKQGLVTVNDRPTKASYEPALGDIIKVVLPPPPPVDVVPEDIPLDILYEDNWLLAINKSAGIVCHPGHPNQTGTIVHAVAFHAAHLSRGSDPFRPGIVHRLDKNTTGVMVIAKTDEAHWRIALQFQRRTTRKEYFALCHGRIHLDGDIINRPLAPYSSTTKHMIVSGGGNLPRQAMFKEAITEYRVATRYRGYTTVELFPKTGRTHQLRVHMASLGHPMVGDGLYGGRVVSEADLAGSGSDEPLIDHQALHARRLCLMHPIHEKPLEFNAPLPPNMTRILELLETHRRL